MKTKLLSGFMLIASCILFGCNNASNKKKENADSTKNETSMKQKIEQFAVVKLNTDLTKLTDKEKQMIPILLDVAKLMDEIFWMETLGDKKVFFNGIKDSDTRRFAEINYGPFERLNENKSFVEGYKDKPAGANFYPQDITKDEYEKFKVNDKNAQYTVIRRKEDKSLESVPYHIAFKAQIDKAVELLNKAAELAEDAGLKKYLQLRAKALATDEYYDSDIAWMEMKTNTLDFVCGPIENYEDALFGTKCAHESALLVKDKEWSKKLNKYLATLPELQKSLPVDAKYKKEVPASGSDLGAYDIIYYAGDCNNGGKTIAINLPNDEKVQLKKGARRLQLKNAMKAKFDNILMPIANSLVDKEQQKYIKFDAFFQNVMLHEVAHGLGIKNVVAGKGTVREALKETYSTIEEGKADILGLFMVSKLHEMGIITEGEVNDNYVTFIAGIIRSVRFGASEAHGKANMICFNFFQDKGAFTRDANGIYKIDFVKTKEAVKELSANILVLQGDGNYAEAQKWIKEKATVRPDLQKDLDKLKTQNIPVDIVFEQGKEALGLK